MYMGCCFSFPTSEIHSVKPQTPPPAKVVSADGTLEEYQVPATASDVLCAVGGDAYFLCNSDTLFYDAFIPVIEREELLAPGQIYFVLPNEMMERPLAIAEMAALAVKASAAIAGSCKKENKPSRNRSIRVMPFAELNDEDEELKRFNEDSIGYLSKPHRSPPQAERKVDRNPSSVRWRCLKKEMLLKRRLSTIEEESCHQR